MVSHEYIAGFFDGEGCITSQLTYITGKYEKQPRINVQITITNTNKQILDDIAEIFGGTVQKKDKGKNRVCYALRITGKTNMERFLNAVYPYLRLKKEQAEIALKFIGTLRTENLGCVSLDSNIHEERKSIHERLRVLKAV